MATYTPVTNGNVNAIVSIGNTVYMGGSFTSAGGVTGLAQLCRYNLATGAVDSTWKPAIAGTVVNCLVVSPDGNHIFVGTTGGNRLHKVAVADATVANFAKVNSNVEAMALDGNDLYVVGQFTTATPYGGAAVTRNRAVKIDVTGSSGQGTIDGSFAPSFGATVNAVAVDSGGVYMGGAFTAFSTSHNRIVKLSKTDGSVASGWSTGTGANQTVRKILVASDGNIFVGGSFTSWDSSTSVGDFLVKLDTNGSRLTGFDTGIVSASRSIYDLREIDGSLFIAQQVHASGSIVKLTGISTWSVDGTFTSVGRLSGGSQMRAIHWDGLNLIIGLEGSATPSYDGVSGWTWAISKTTGAVVELQSDTTSPTVTLASGSVSSGGYTNLVSIPMTATFSENVTGFVAGDITVSGGSVSGFSGSGSSYSFDFIPSGDGSKSVSVAAGVCQDSFQNTNTASSAFTFTVDTVQPTVSLSGSVASGGSSTSSLVSMTATFSESVTGFVLGDISVTNGTASNFAGSGSVYTFDVTPSSLGLVSVSIGSNAAQDIAGNQSQASSSYSWTKTSATQPVLSPTSPSVVRKEILSTTMSKSEVQSLTGVNPASWKRVLVVYTSSGKKNVVCSYKPAPATPASRFRANINTSATYTMAKIIVVKTDGTSVIVDRASVSSPSQYDVSVT